MVNLFSGIYNGKTVLLTGDTGFKGSWLALWLSKMGANVIGFSDKVPTNPSHFELLKSHFPNHIQGNINNLEEISSAIRKNKIDLVFHLAAQSLVRYSYRYPIETFETNVMGTLNVLEASKNHSIKGVVVVTSDKCYENFEDDRAYSEEDRMGGYDPYSASKGCAELLVNSYRRSFYPAKDFEKHHFIVSSGRAGNVIGGGDWSEDRLIPDIVKNANKKESTVIRNPFATRPWQHVLEPLSGYLLLGQKILEGDISVGDGWNFGPLNNETKTVDEVIKVAKEIWNDISIETPEIKDKPHEASLLRLDCTKANTQLNWKPVWNSDIAIKKTIEWYKSFYTNNDLLTEADLTEYVNSAKSLNYNWAK